MQSYYCSSSCYIKQLVCLYVYKQNGALLRRKVSPLDIFSPFHLTPASTTIGSHIVTCFLQAFRDVIRPQAFCSKKGYMLCTFSLVIFGSLSVKLLQCSICQMSIKFEGKRQALQILQWNMVLRLMKEIQTYRCNNCF